VIDGQPAHTSALAGRDIVCVGFNDWDAEVWTNQHHLMARLAADNQVLFIESLGLRRPTLAGRDVRRMARRAARGLEGPRVVATRDSGNRLRVLSPLVLPAHSSPLARRANAFLLPRLVGRATRRLGMSEPILWAYVPQAQLLVDRLRPRLVIYHCVDDIAAHPRIDSASFEAAERSFARRADLVLASSAPLAERMRRLGCSVHYLPNVADVDLFATARGSGPTDPSMAALPEPRIVFTGVIAATKIDFPLLVELAGLRPDWSIVLVGPVGLGDPLTDTSDLAGLPNLHLVGPRRYAELPAVLRAAQAAIIPYQLNQLTASIFPMKVYEYLAAGLPVVATALPSLQGVDGISFADGAAEMAARLDRVMAEDGPGARTARARLAEGHSWSTRVQEIAALIARHEAA
jgi:glycosyltransferase involved in cell wall biosynthesis